MGGGARGTITLKLQKWTSALPTQSCFRGKRGDFPSRIFFLSSPKCKYQIAFLRQIYLPTYQRHFLQKPKGALNDVGCPKETRITDRPHKSQEMNTYRTTFRATLTEKLAKILHGHILNPSWKGLRNRNNLGEKRPHGSRRPWSWPARSERCCTQTRGIARRRKKKIKRNSRCDI